MAYNFEYPYTDPGYGNDDWLINTVKQLVKDWENVSKDWSDVKEYIDNYFKNLDVSEEIADKIQDLIDDGTIENIINQQIFGDLNSKVDNIETSTTQKIDALETSTTQKIDEISSDLETIENKTLENETELLYLDWDIKDVDNSFNGFRGRNQGWDVIRVEDQIVMSGTRNVHPASASGWSINVSEVVNLALDMPFEPNRYAISSSSNSNALMAVNTQIDNTNVLKFRLYTPLSSSALDIGAATRPIRIMIAGEHAIAPNDASNSYNASKVTELMAVAESYINAVASGRRFSYGLNWLYGTSYPVNNEAGEGMCECDTFVWLCLAGITYSNSPYNNSTYNKENVPIDTTKSWTIKDLRNFEPFGFIDNTGEENAYMWNKGWVFNPRDTRETIDGAKNPRYNKIDWSLVRTGDIVIKKHKDKKFFDNIAHIGLIRKTGDTLDDINIIHCSGPITTGGKIIAEQPFYEVYNPNTIHEDDFYFARIKY